MGSQGFRNIAGNPFVYQEDTRSAAFGLDAAAQKWKLSVKATAGALPTDTPQLMIDPATNGDVTIDPNGSGNFVVTSGDITATLGNINLTSNTKSIVLPATSSAQIKLDTIPFLRTLGGSGYGADQISIFMGYNAGGASANSHCSANCGIGSATLAAAVGCQENFAMGYHSLNLLTGSDTCGYRNVAIGNYSGYQLVGSTSGGTDGDASYNTMIGYGAGGQLKTTEYCNIYLNSVGVTGENNTLRLGTSTASGRTGGAVNAAYICGIYGKSVGATNGLVYIDNANLLGSTNSPSVTGSIGAGTTVTAGTNLVSTAGNLLLPTSSSTVGQIQIGTYRYLFGFVGSGGDAYYPNLFIGREAGNFTMTSAAAGNIGIGTRCLDALSSGQNNCAWGQDSATALDSGGDNLAIGTTSLATATSASRNVALGSFSLYTATSALENISIATRGLRYLTTGARNVAIGMSPNVTAIPGTYFGSGDQYTSSETGNCLINSAGVTGESNKLRIGAGTGTGVSQFDKAFISGIYGITPGGTINVALVDSNGQLGSTATLSPSLGGTMAWTEVTGTSQTAAVGNGYITNNVALVTVTLPATAAVGQRVAIVGKGAGLWKFAQNSGQTIHFGSVDSTTGTGGYLAATVKYDCLEVICITANTDWVVRDSVGSITIV